MVDVEALIRPVVEGAGLELFDFVYDRAGGHRILRVTVDRPGGLDLDTIAATSDKIAPAGSIDRDAQDATPQIGRAHV